jgi:CheY-like chemotaxis protein
MACIVDDDPIFVFSTKKLMELNDFAEEIVVYSNGQEALDELVCRIDNGNEMPDVIFLDLNIPVLDGWDFLDEFTKIPSQKEMIIYIVTSSIDPADVNRAKGYKNVNNYVVKPITTKDLGKILAEM